jgi:ribosomal protein S6
MNRYYGMVCIISSALSEQEVEQVIQKSSHLIAEHGGTEIKSNKLGKKLLAYPIVKKGQGILITTNSLKSSRKVAGIYIQIQYLADSKEVSEIIKGLQANQEFVRCLIVKLKSDQDDWIIQPKPRKKRSIKVIDKKVIEKIEEQQIIVVDDDDDDEDDAYEENDEQPPVLSPEERKRIKAENINYLHRTVDRTPELFKLKNAANDDAWENLTEWIAESICDINFTAASKSVTRLITRVGHKTPREIAHRLIIHKSLQAAGLELIGDVVATVNNILDGLGAEGINLPEIAKLGAEMVSQIAQIYGFNIDAPERKEEALFLFGLIFLGEKIIDIGIDWLKLGYINNKILKVGSKALMIYGLGHAACFYYEYKAEFEFSLIPPDDLLKKLRQERDNYFPDDLSEATVKQKLIVEISIAFPEINYELLESLLAEKKWREADMETEYIISELLNRNIKDDTSKIFKQDINQIDELWYHYSQGKFGFQVQRDIFQQSDINKKIGKFGEALGWRGKAFLGIGVLGAFSWKDYDKLVFELDKSPKGHLPAFWFHKYEKHNGFIVKSYLKPILERDDWQNIKALPLSEDVKLAPTPNDV